MGKDKNLLLAIQASYNQLTKTERKVADYVIKNQKDVLYMSITDLADACKVGDTSVYRFCRTMGLQGYQEFKMRLSLSQAETQSMENIGGVSAEGKTGELSEKVLELHLAALKETYMLLSRNELNKTIELIEKANRVYFFGIGDSLLTAEEGRNKFLRVTKKVTCITDPHMQAMAASLCDKNDLIIIISYSGATKDNIHVAKEAKDAGAKIVGITHFSKSPLTAYADAILLCGANEAPLEGGSMSAKVSQLYIIDLLYQEYYSRNKKLCHENNKRTSKSVVEKLF